MPAGWRTVSVFISSTFRDMQAERDHLVRFVFPRLRAELLKRRVHLVDVDLRWGVTSEQDALSVCREMIDECRPRFLCMLGGRYGWIPPGEERSITADEVYYAALEETEPGGYEFFYFREPAATDSIPEDASREGGYREFPTEQDVDELGEERAQELAAERTRKLESLKQAVRDAGLPVFEYPCRWDEEKQRLVDLQAFGDAVYRDLMASIDDELGADPPPALDWFSEENAAMESFIEERTGRYVVGSRQALLDDMTAHAEGSDGPGVLVVTGEPGSGKSALLGRFYRDYAASHPDVIVIPHFVGASRGSTSLRQTLRRLCHEIAHAAGIEDEIPEDVRELAALFPDLLARAAETNRVLVVIDALNQLDATDNAHALTWLPWQLPDRARIVCSSLEHPVLEVLRRRSGHVREIACGPLTSEDAGAIVDVALALYHKRLDDAQRSALLAKPDAGTPLYLLAALEELRTLGTYELITGRIEQLPGTVTELFDWILERLEQGVEGQEAFGEHLVSTYTACIAVGRGGMTEGELEALCAPFDEEDEFWVLHRMLRPYLMPRGELVDYFHGQLREAVEQRYLPDEDARRHCHAQIAILLHDRADPLRETTWASCPALDGQLREHLTLRALTELPHHLTAAQEWETLETLLTDLRFLECKTEAGMVFDLAGDFTVAVDAIPRERPVWKHLRLLNQALRNDLHFISRHPTTLFQCFWNSAWWYDCPEAAKHYDPPEGGCGPDGAPWERPEPRLCTLLERWRKEKERRQPGFYWVRSLRPPPQALGDAQIMCLHGHEDGVPAIAFSPDGRYMASGSRDETVRTWDLATGEQLMCIRGHQNSVTAVAFSPDQTLIVSGSLDKTLRVWESETGAEVACLVAHEDPVTSTAFSPDGRYLTSGSWDETVRIWDLSTGAQVTSMHGHEDDVKSVSFSPDGKRIASASSDRTVRTWDAQNGHELVCMRGHESGVMCIAFSPDGKRIASASLDRTTRVWDSQSGQQLLCLRGHDLCLRGHDGAVQCVVFSPDGARIASGANDCTLRVWDAETGAELACLQRHRSSVTSAAFSPDGLRLASGSEDGTIRLWDAAPGPKVPRLDGDRACVLRVAISPDGGRIATAAHDGTVRVWDAQSGCQIPCATALDSKVEMMDFSPDGRRLAAGSYGLVLRVWDAGSGEELACLRGYRGRLRRVVFSPDGRWVATEAERDQVRIWDVGAESIWRWFSRGRQVACVDAVPGSLAFSFDGRRFALGVPDSEVVRVCDTASGVGVNCLSGHGGPVTSVAFSPDGRGLASGSPDGTVRVWDGESGVELACLRGHECGVNMIAFSPDGRRLAARSWDHTVRVWDATDYKCVDVVDASIAGDQPWPIALVHIAAGRQGPAWRAQKSGLRTIVEEMKSHVAVWLPIAPDHLIRDPSSCTWAGTLNDYLALITLEGNASTDEERPV